MSSEGSVTHWIGQLKAGNSAAAQPLWERYFQQLVRLAREPVGGNRQLESGSLQRRPDVAYISFNRWPRNREVQSTAAWDVIPNLAIEIVSPTSGANEIVEKIENHFTAGVERVWVVYPTIQKVYDYSAPDAVQILTPSKVLEGGNLLPGFQLPLAEIFEEQTSPRAAT